MTSTITSFRYAGGKTRLLPFLSEHLDKLLINQTEFCDAFVGGGSVALYVAQKYPNIKIFLNDKDEYVSNFWQIVSGEFKTLQVLLTRLDQPVTIEHFLKLSQAPPIDDLERAYHAIFFNRTCFSGIVKRDGLGRVTSSPIGGKEQLSKYKVNCRYNPKKLKEKILACHKLLAGRTFVENKDFSEYESLIKGNMPVYLDPPYKIKGSMLYTEFMNTAQHQSLAQILSNRSNWVLSYDDCDEIRELYKNNKIIDLAAKYSITSNNKEWNKKNELIILP